MQKMNGEELKQFLETQQNSISEDEFFSLVFSMLENEATKETREILESYLMEYSHVDEDRVARYLGKFLHNPDPHVLTFVFPELAKLARKPNSLAERIIVEFSEEGIRRRKEDMTWEEAEEAYLTEKAKTVELEQYLEEQEKKLTEKDFFELILGMLENDPQKEARDVLKTYLIVHAHVDEDRVARYLEQYLSDPDSIQRELAVHDLAFFAHEPNSLAYKILTDYLGEEPTKDNKWKILGGRLIDLFPRSDSEEDQ